MKNHVLITVSYIAEIEKESFWEKGKINTIIAEKLRKRFPKKLKLTDEHKATRQHLSHLIIDGSQSSPYFRCPRCNAWTVDRSKSCYMPSVRTAKDVNGTLYCEICAYDVKWELDLKTK